MNTLLETNQILETNAVVESVRQTYDQDLTRPRPEWVRGTCPQCGAEIVANCYYVASRGYLILHQCWESLGDNPTCAYRKVI
jgi:hypothetical protein